MIAECLFITGHLRSLEEVFELRAACANGRSKCLDVISSIPDDLLSRYAGLS